MSIRVIASIFLLLLSPVTFGSGPHPAVCSHLFKHSKIAPYFEFQYNDTSCSLASTAPIFNSILAKIHGKSHNFLPQSVLLKKLENPSWERAIAADGDGVVLDQLKDYIQQGLAKLGIKNYQVKVYHLQDYNAEQLDRLLKAASKGHDDYVILNFMQKDFTKNPFNTEGHFANLGKYESESKTALIMDPDATTGGAYWVDLESMLKGLSSVDEGPGLSRGLLWIQKIP